MTTIMAVDAAANVSYGTAVLAAGVLGVLALTCLTLGALAAHVMFVGLIEEVTEPDERRYPVDRWLGYVVCALACFGVGCACLFMGAVVVAKNWGAW